MNANLFHNILNAAIALLSGLTAVLMATGCETLASGALECSQSWLPPEYAAIAVTVLAVAKIAVNILRDGFAGLAKVQPPVVK